MEEAGQEDVLRKIKRDFEKASIKFEDSESVIIPQEHGKNVRMNKTTD